MFYSAHVVVYIGFLNSQISVVLCCVLGQDTLLSQCLSPPRYINGYW